MTTHSSVLAWRIPGTREPGGLSSMGSHSRTRLKRLSNDIFNSFADSEGCSISPKRFLSIVDIMVMRGRIEIPEYVKNLCSSRVVGIIMVMLHFSEF